jgi:TRAP-type C4-dicarboxylate transport system permease small subunit
VLRTLAKGIVRISARLNGFSAAAVVFIMLLTCADVVLRAFGKPIPGTYELVGYFGVVIVAFALAQTSVERGHIAVELFVDRLPRRAQALIEGLGGVAATALFSVLAWQSQLYARDLMESGDVSLTLGIPTWPFVLCMMFGCLTMAVALLVDAVRQLQRGVRP